MAKIGRENPPGFSESEKHTIYSVCKRLFSTIYGVQKRAFALRALEISRDDRWAVRREIGVLRARRVSANLRCNRILAGTGMTYSSSHTPASIKE